MGINGEQIKRAYEIMEAVKSLDREIVWLSGDQPGILAGNGEKIRNAIGRNKISHFSDIELGRIVNKGIISALLERRKALVSAHEGWIDFPDAPTTDEANPTNHTGGRNG